MEQEPAGAAEERCFQDPPRHAMRRHPAAEDGQALGAVAGLGRCEPVPSKSTLSDIFPTGYVGAELCEIAPRKVFAVGDAGPVGKFVGPYGPERSDLGTRPERVGSATSTAT